LRSEEQHEEEGSSKGTTKAGGWPEEGLGEGARANDSGAEGKKGSDPFLAGTGLKGGE